MSQGPKKEGHQTPEWRWCEGQNYLHFSYSLTNKAACSQLKYSARLAMNVRISLELEKATKMNSFQRPSTVICYLTKPISKYRVTFLKSVGRRACTQKSVCLQKALPKKRALKMCTK